MTFGTGTLRTGSTDPGVRELQQWLIDRQFLLASAPSGTFDDATYHAVRAFQYSAGIGVDGVVGGGTRTAAEGFTGTATTTGWHPTAVRDVQVDRSGGSFTTTTRRGVLHTTEGTRLPNYDNPPHFTIGRDGAGGRVQLWQHYPVTLAARALRHPAGTPETNRFGAIQVEIIGSAANMATLAADDADLFDALGRWMRWVETTTGVANAAPHAFGGRDDHVRLDDAQWAASSGWVGHQHVPNNNHWDPGRIDIAGLLAVGSTPAQAPATAESWAASASSDDDGGHEWCTTLATPAASPVAGRPRIRATTRRLTNSFPSLSFSVETMGAPYFEVMLTTDRTLFAPEQAARRTSDNFYASRAEGLRSTERSRGRYVAPIDVVQRFAAAHPAGTPIWYSVTSFADEQGSGPVPAAAPETLARTAPSVPMMPGFRGHTATETLGVPLGMLRPAARQMALVHGRTRIGGGRGVAFADPPPMSPSALPPIDPVPDADDRLEGEDGYDLPPAAPGRPPEPAAPSAPIPAPTPPSMPAPPPEPAPSAPPVAAPSAPSPPPPPASPSVGTEQLAYDDGFGDWDTAALGSTFPAGHAQPRALYDSEAPVVADDEFDDLGWAGSAYGAAGGEPAPAEPAPSVPTTPAPGWRRIASALDPATKRDVIEAYVGDDLDLYGAIDPDGAFSGSRGTDHPAYQRHHLGLSFGIAAFSQDAGALGQLLTLMKARDPEAYASTFGPDADELLEVLNRPGPLSKDTPDGRSARVQPVAGTDVWEEPWRSRFVAAGQHRPFRGAQIELAAGMYLDPVLQFATDLELATERGLAIIFDRAAHRGTVGGMNWVIETVGPFQTPMLQRDALHALGFADVEAFQRTQPDLLVDDQFGPLTHAALTAAVRAAGVPSATILDARQMIAALAERATGQPWGDRIVRLAGADLDDEPLVAGAPS